MKKLIFILLWLFLTGCSSHSGVVPSGPDSFMVSRGNATGFSSLTKLKNDALEEAAQYCISQKKNMRIVKTTESSPPYIMGNFPRIEIQFMCLDKTDVELISPEKE